MLLTIKPASTAPKNPIQALWENALTTTPTKAEISIVPSRAMLLVPDLEEIIAVEDNVEVNGMPVKMWEEQKEVQ